MTPTAKPQQRKLQAPSPRPQRVSLIGEDGRRCTLAAGAEAFVRLDAGQGLPAAALVLGLGPEAARELAQGPLAQCQDVLWLDCPACIASMEAQTPGWLRGLAAGWKALAAGQDTPDAAAVAAQAGPPRRAVFWYRQNMRLFPSFWGPVLGAVQAALLGLSAPPVEARAAAGAWAAPQSRTVLLPGGTNDLLHRELAAAFASAGYGVRCPQAAPRREDAGQPELHAWRHFLQEERPALFFSVNGRGLDAQGVDFALLRACGVPVALWLVDNPWHILSGWQQGWWREAHLFITDHSFIPGLQQAGAARVHHLPLAAAQHMAAERHRAAERADEGTHSPFASGHATLVHFVGRAAFPARDQFFAAARVPEGMMEEARAHLCSAAPPHFHWWAQQLDVPLWPGYAVRSAGLGAERCSALRRAQWLRAALPTGLTLHGDEDGWRALLPEAAPQTFQPAVDYYGALPRLYATARYSLNVTSLLLPAGLTQRHFDVWAAGGFLLGDATPGLDIFPAALTRETGLAGPQCLAGAVHRLEREPQLRRHLQEAWQAQVDAAHTYAHRVQAVLERVQG